MQESLGILKERHQEPDAKSEQVPRQLLCSGKILVHPSLIDPLRDDELRVYSTAENWDPILFSEDMM